MHDRVTDAKWFGVDQNERYLSRGIISIDPGMIGAALNHNVAGFHCDG
jgi:hypothetical protein